MLRESMHCARFDLTLVIHIFIFHYNRNIRSTPNHKAFFLFNNVSFLMRVVPFGYKVHHLLVFSLFVLTRHRQIWPTEKK